MRESDPLESIRGIGESVAKKFAKLDVYTVGDLINYFPKKYLDYSNISKISKINPGDVTIKANIKQVTSRYFRGLHITSAIASDETGSVRITWFNQRYRAKAILKNGEYFISGKFGFNKSWLGFVNPNIEQTGINQISTARIVPMYKETKGLSSTQIRKFINNILNINVHVNDILPKHILISENLISRLDAINYKHFPKNKKQIEVADQRLGFEEIFELIIASSMAKKSISESASAIIKFDQKLAIQFVKSLPFELTQSQKKCMWQILKDISQAKPMNRMLEGDVGAGKTIVAAMSAIMAIKQGYQVAFMSPTEVLAQQHAKTLSNVLGSLKLADQVVLLVGGTKQKNKNEILNKIKTGKKKLIVGTHSLIQQNINYQNLALVIVDEQHRFGVEQRKILLKKSKFAPHMLTMTATPIPRSLALTIFGELDISIINEKPKNRKPVKSKLIDPTEVERFYELIKTKLDQKEQMFVVCPLIDNYQSGSFSKTNSVKATFDEMVKIFPDKKVGLLHGKLKSDEKEAVLNDFVQHRIDILVSTTVIEVGVDVPNANIMLIKDPNNFGLAQLHQLRGRVGRGDKQGYCYLMLNDNNQNSTRLRAFITSNDGFKLAELDLKIRGAGALYGKYQHGKLDLRIADFTDTKLIARARKSAKEILKNDENLIKYPYIKQRAIELQTVVHLN
jgi:ATP-dependent DNA helicase RecG